MKRANKTIKDLLINASFNKEFIKKLTYTI